MTGGIKGQRRHMSVSVDIDRFADAELRKRWVGVFFDGDREMSVAEIRVACAAHRARGLAVFPPCAHTGPDGRCLGHDEDEVVDG